MIIQCCAGEHCTVRVESRASDGRRTIMVKEARVRFERGEIGAVNIVGPHLVTVCAPGRLVNKKICQISGILENIHAEHRGMFMYAECPQRVFGCVYGRECIVHAKIP